MLDYQMIEVLDAIVLQGSFGGAARSLHLTQSAISQRLKTLEEQLGARLIVRSQPPRPTALGLVLLEHVREVQRLEQDVNLAMHADPGRHFSTITLGVNADSLATWFFDVFASVLQKGQILVDLIIENEALTFARLQRGEVLGCISSRSRRLAGCEVQRLGVMKYHCAASPDFKSRYFEDGLSEAALRLAPAVIFDQFDDVHQKFLEKYFGLKDFKFPAHKIAASQAFLDAIRHGIAYGLAPELQAAEDFKSGRLVKLSARKVWKEELYWHCQRHADQRVRALNREVVVRAKKALR